MVLTAATTPAGKGTSALDCAGGDVVVIGGR
jgi:hypothetical protein